MVDFTTTRCCELNDAFRIAGPATADWIMTAGVHEQGTDFVVTAIGKVRGFTDFNRDNDPYHEHDFGAFDLAGQKLFWKIDYYDHSLQAGSENPADPALTRRVLTIMLASEY